MMIIEMILVAVTMLIICVALAGAVLTVKDAQVRHNLREAKRRDINTEARLRKRRMD